jgi:ATP/maltotriose-dependent transcriptional regulator MalT
MTLGTAPLRTREDEPLVGRSAALASLRKALDEIERDGPGAFAIVGEPGIGKTRLLRELAALAEQRTCLVLSGSASELERDLPFSVFVDAVDEYVESLGPAGFSTLDDDVRAELAHVFPSLSPLAGRRRVALQHERYRSHRAVRSLLELLAERSSLVLVLDDLHWADSASVELLGALLRRPPDAPVLLALALRPRPQSERLSVALDSAHRAGVLSSIELSTLSAGEAREFLGESVAPADAGLLYEESGGNPFYLEQLVRSLDRADRTVPVGEISLTDVPSAVVASLSQELSALSPAGRLLLEGAAVAGDPFEPELAAAAAATSEAAAIDVLDELLRLDLVRSTDVPRRFRFRHPLIRRAVYETTAGAWRLGAHERCADALAARGASAIARAHHVERSAREGDLDAVAVLREAGEAALRLAPASAARWFADALRLLPEGAPQEERTQLLLARAEALAADGHFADAHEALRDALATAPRDAIPLRTALTAACARVEYMLGKYEEAHTHVRDALDELPERVSSEAVRLMIELALISVPLTRYEAAIRWAEDALNVARRLDDEPLTACALAMTALGEALSGAGPAAEAHASEVKERIDALSDDELAGWLDAAIWLAAAEFYCDRYPDSDAHVERALAAARASGQGELLLFFLYLQGRVWYVRGKLVDATELIDGAIEAARLLGNREALAWSLYNRSAVALASGDLDLALTTAEESVALTRDVPETYVTAWAGVRLAAVLFEIGQPAGAIEAIAGSAGGEELTLIPPGWRPYCFELVCRCHLALDQVIEAEQAAARARSCTAAVQLPMAEVWTGRATAALELHRGDPVPAGRHALTAATAADELGAPIDAALARILAGRALARAGDQDSAVVELRRAAAALDGYGALRYRDEAERELGKLGHRTHRRSRPGKSGGQGIEMLTARELEVAQLVVERKTNPEIAAQLYLSNKTVESHLRNIFHKLNVTSRVELARAVERATP